MRSSIAFRLTWDFWCFRRNVLVRQAESEKYELTDITPKDFAVRTVAQEYGGGAFSISGDSVIFSNYKDQRLYQQSLSAKGQSFLGFFLKKILHDFYLIDSVCSVAGGVPIYVILFLV